MEFWGIEVKPGETVQCLPGEDKYLHLSQAALGVVKKATESIPLILHVDGKKLVLGTLSNECNHISFDLVFEKNVALSHSSKNGSVYFCGYRAVKADDGMEEYSDSDSDSEEDVPLGLPIENDSDSDSEEDIPPGLQIENGNLAVRKEENKSTAENSKAAKVELVTSKSKVKIVEPSKDAKPKADEDDEDEDDDDEDEDDDEDDDMSDNEDMQMLGSGEDDEDSDEDEDEEDGSSEEEDEETPKKDGKGKKRTLDSATKTPAPEKKARLATPAAVQKTDGKKSGHTATPYPTKPDRKIPASDGKEKQQTPASQGKKTGSQITCKSCTKSFNSDQALEAHTKAKHSGGN